MLARENLLPEGPNKDKNPKHQMEENKMANETIRMSQINRELEEIEQRLPVPRPSAPPELPEIKITNEKYMKENEKFSTK